MTRPPVPSSCSFCSLPLPASTTHNGPGCWSPGFPNRVFRYGNNRISRVPGRSSRYMPCSHQTPAGPERQAIQRPRCCLPLQTRRRLPQFGFRGSITRPTSSLSTLRSPGYPGKPRKTRFRAVANLTRAGFDPQDLFGRFPKRLISRHLFPLPRALLGARLAPLPSRHHRLRSCSADLDGLRLLARVRERARSPDAPPSRQRVPGCSLSLPPIAVAVPCRRRWLPPLLAAADAGLRVRDPCPLLPDPWARHLPAFRYPDGPPPGSTGNQAAARWSRTTRPSRISTTRPARRARA